MTAPTSRKLDPDPLSQLLEKTYAVYEDIIAIQHSILQWKIVRPLQRPFHLVPLISCLQILQDLRTEAIKNSIFFRLGSY